MQRTRISDINYRQLTDRVRSGQTGCRCRRRESLGITAAAVCWLTAMQRHVSSSFVISRDCCHAALYSTISIYRPVLSPQPPQNSPLSRVTHRDLLCHSLLSRRHGFNGLSSLVGHFHIVTDWLQSLFAHYGRKTPRKKSSKETLILI